MTYELKNYNALFGTPGFSDQLLKNHFTLYKGYVDNTNKLIQELLVLLKEGEAATPKYAEIKRRFVWEYNGMKLHEFYFDGMSTRSAPFDRESEFADRMEKGFGSAHNWEKSFRAVGGMRGVGWALLCYDPEGRSLYNVWINEHDANIPFRAVPLLLMDVWEHAFLLDYGVKRDGYIDAFLKTVNWSIVNNRFEAATRELATATV